MAARQQDLTISRDPGAPAGNHPQERAQPQRRGEPRPWPTPTSSLPTASACPAVEPLRPCRTWWRGRWPPAPNWRRAACRCSNSRNQPEGRPQRPAAFARCRGERSPTTAWPASPATCRVVPGRTRTNNPYFVGGYGSVLSPIVLPQLPGLHRGFQPEHPLRNRAAQADMINDELTLRQTQLQLQRLENQVRVDVQQRHDRTPAGARPIPGGREGAGSAGADAGRGAEEIRPGRIHHLQRDSGAARPGHRAVDRSGGHRTTTARRGWNWTGYRPDARQQQHFHARGISGRGVAGPRPHTRVPPQSP